MATPSAELQTLLHHGCSVVVSNAVTNGNPVHGQSNMEAPGGCVKGRVSRVCLGCVCPRLCINVCVGW